MIANEIKLFKNLAEWDLEGTYFDLRKDFECFAVRYEKNVLVLEFKESVSPTSHFSMTCENAELIRINASVKKPAEALTLDNFYRGNYEVNGHLIDVDGVRAYFYLEFYEGPILEFWAEELRVERNEMAE